MLRRLVPATLILATAGCAGMRGAATAQPQGIAAPSYFDTATCSPAPQALPAAPDTSSLLGALLNTRGPVLECLVDPAHRQGDAQTRLKLAAEVGPAGAKHTVSGSNLTPAGQRCVQAVVERLAPLPTSATPARAEVEFAHHVRSSPAVLAGGDEPSTLAGRVRLAQPQWCDCYAPFQGTTPPELQATVSLERRVGEVITSVQWDATALAAPGAQALSQCLEGKLKALGLEPQKVRTQFPVAFRFVNSRATETAAHLSPELRFIQLDGLRTGRVADVNLAVGARTGLAKTYDGLVKDFNALMKQGRRASVDALVSATAKLKSTCAQLVKTDDAWLAALQSQRELEQATVGLVAQLEAKDARWAQAGPVAQKQVAQTDADLAGAQKAKEADVAACAQLED